MGRCYSAGRQVPAYLWAVDLWIEGYWLEIESFQSFDLAELTVQEYRADGRPARWRLKLNKESDDTSDDGSERPGQRQ